MRILPDDRQLYISARMWQDVQSKVDLKPFIFALHEGIDLRKYGNGLEKFYFTFIIVPPEDEINLPYCHYDPENCEVDMGTSVSYQLITKSSRAESFRMMERAYLEGIDLIKTLPLKSSFDVESFRNDVAAIFAKAGWYEEFS